MGNDYVSIIVMENRLDFLKKKKEEYLAQIMALNGAIQVLEELISDSTKEGE